MNDIPLPTICCCNYGNWSQMAVVSREVCLKGTNYASSQYCQLYLRGKTLMERLILDRSVLYVFLSSKFNILMSVWILLIVKKYLNSQSDQLIVNKTLISLILYLNLDMISELKTFYFWLYARRRYQTLPNDAYHNTWTE